MIVALFITLTILAVGAILYLHEVSYRRKHPQEDNPEETAAPQEQKSDEECCGMHITCERDSLLAGISDKIEYYDDEELDAYRGRDADGYTDAEIEQFRDVLLTLLPDDIAGWYRSIQLRGINLPTAVRDELLLIVSEERAARASNPTH